MKVSYLVGNYIHGEGSKGELIHYKLNHKFMEEQLDQQPEEVQINSFSLYHLISIAQHCINDFAFRKSK